MLFLASPGPPRVQGWSQFYNLFVCWAHTPLLQWSQNLKRRSLLGRKITVRLSDIALHAAGLAEAETNFHLDFNWIYNSRTSQQRTFCTVGGLKMKASLQYLLQDSILKADLTEITGIFCSESTPARCHAISPLTLVSHRSPARVQMCHLTLQTRLELLLSAVTIFIF